MMSNTTHKRTRTDLCFLLIAAAVLVLHIVKATVGMGESDEHFYITLGYRLYQGDAMFFDDWHIAQMIGIFIYPLVALFHAVTGSMDGIVLGFRYFYIAFNLLLGCAFYYRFRHRGVGAVFGTCAIFLFAPYNTFALSYNSMGPGFLLLAALLYPLESESEPRLFFSGLLYAWAVLNTPYLAMIFVILTILTIARPKFFSRKRWLWMFLGILTAALIFIAFVLSRASLGQILSCLKYLIDPSHSAGMIRQFAVSMGKLALAFNVFWIPMAGALIAAVKIRKKPAETQAGFLGSASFIALLACVYIAFVHPYQAEMGGYMLILVPITLLGVELLFLRDMDTELKLCFILSLIDSLAIALSSNVGPRAFSGPLITACAITLICLWESDVNVPVKDLGIFAMLALLLWFNASFVYLGEGDYSRRIENGPLAGLYDSAEAVTNYSRSLDDIEHINALTEYPYANLITADSWEYLALTKRMASNSTYAYFWEQDQYTDAMDQYRIVHPERYPAYYYLDRIGNRYGMKENDPWLTQFERIETMQNGSLYIAR
ncbi:MAG: hypothetical protein IJ201_06500 [Solobacterium sp.]|nr:hypothetical protein [Solobacterium sp.]